MKDVQPVVEAPVIPLARLAPRIHPPDLHPTSHIIHLVGFLATNDASGPLHVLVDVVYPSCVHCDISVTYVAQVKMELEQSSQLSPRMLAVSWLLIGPCPAHGPFTGSHLPELR